MLRTEAEIKEKIEKYQRSLVYYNATRNAQQLRKVIKFAYWVLKETDEDAFDDPNEKRND